MKRISVIICLMCLSICGFAQKAAYYGDYMKNGFRRLESHDIKLYRWYKNGQKGGTDCTIIKVFNNETTGWFLEFCINEGRIHIAKNSPLYFGYPNSNNLVESVVKIITEDGKPGLMNKTETFCYVLYSITEEQIKKICESNQIEQVLIYTADGNIGRMLRKGFQKKFKEQYEFIQKLSSEECHNKYKAM